MIIPRANFIVKLLKPHDTMCIHSSKKTTPEYLFRYKVETSLWKNPFDKEITDEVEYSVFRHRNAYHDLQCFADADPQEARRKAFRYLRSMIDVLCESIGKTFRNYWQAARDLQPLLRANHPLAHKQLCDIQFDDDILCGVSLTMQVQKGKKSDHVAIFNLGVNDDSHREEILYDVVRSIVELERERRYYRQAGISVKAEKIDLSGIGMADAEVMQSLMDWKEFTSIFNGIDIDAVLDTTAILDRQCEPLIH